MRRVFRCCMARVREFVDDFMDLIMRKSGFAICERAADAPFARILTVILRDVQYRVFVLGKI